MLQNRCHIRACGRHEALDARVYAYAALRAPVSRGLVVGPSGLLQRPRPMANHGSTLQRIGRSQWMKCGSARRLVVRALFKMATACHRLPNLGPHSRFQGFLPDYQELLTKYSPNCGCGEIQPQHPRRILASLRHCIGQKASYLFFNLEVAI